jgi:hypothetical protein
MLTAYSILLILDLWHVFDGLFKAGPSGKSYIELERKYVGPKSPIMSRWIVRTVIGCAIGSAADILMVGRRTECESY